MSHWLNKIAYTRLFFANIAVIAALILYWFGFTYLIVPASLLYIAYIVPMPRVFDSVFSRTVVALFVFFGIYQMVATLQQFFFTQGKFLAAAAVVTLLLIISGYLVKAHVEKKDIDFRRRLFSSRDAIAVAATLLFIVPFGVYLFNGSLHENIAQIGGIQAIDGANHWNQISSNSYGESIVYDRDNYFPAGFHITTSFIQDSFGFNPNNISEWKTSSLLYIAHYLLAAMVFIFVAVYFAFALAGSRIDRVRMLALVFAITPSLIAFFIIPFIYNGFLNHFYVCSAIILLAIIFADTGNNDLSRNREINRRSPAVLLGVYYLTAYGAAMSWPLIAPPLILAPILMFFTTGSWRSLRPRVLLGKIAPIMTGTLILSIPVLIQIFSSQTDPASSILLDGGLKIWHIGIYLIGIIGLGWLYFYKDKYSLISNGRLWMFCLSFLILILGLASIQYFLLGNVRYYTIKTSSILEVIILLVLAYAAVAVSMKSLSLTSIVATTFIVPFCMVLAISFNDNPFKEMRSLFRTYSHEQKPPFFDQDIEAITNVAERNDTYWINYLTLHRTTDSGKLFTHIQIPFWASTLRKDMKYGDRASGCLFQLYRITLFGDYSESSQQAMRKKIHACADIAKDNNRQYVILTDADSYEDVKKIFSDHLNIRVEKE